VCVCDVLQVYLADNTATGIIMIVGMCVCSPIAAVAATLGSFIGILTGVAVGANPAAVYFGLWGYNSVLGAITVGGMFFVINGPCIPFAAYCAVMCALTTPTIGAILGTVGVPAMTFPFCVCALTFYLLQGSVSKIIAGTDALQCAAVCCSVLQCVAICVNHGWYSCSRSSPVHGCCSVPQYVATCCSVPQCVATCCSVPQCVATCCSVCSSLRVHVYCSVVQYGATCWSVLHCVAGYVKHRRYTILKRHLYPQ